MKTKLPALPTLIATAIALVSWSSSFVFIRVALTAYAPGNLALFRYLIVSITMLFFYIPLKKKTKPNKQDMWQLLFLGVFGIGLYMIALNYAEVTESASITSFIIGLNPIVAMLWACIFFKEAISYKRWIGVIVSVIGLAIIASGQIHSAKLDWGILLTLFATTCAGIYNVAQKPLMKRFHAIEVAAISAWIGTAIMLVFTPSMLSQIPHAAWHATTSVIYLGVIPGAIGYAAWSYAIAKVESASKLTLVLYGLPLLTTLMGWMFIGEIPTLFEFIGGCVSLVGALIATRF